MNNRRLCPLVLIFLLLVASVGLCQKREAQEQEIDRFTFTFGMKSLFLVDTEVSYPAVYGIPHAFNVYFDGNLFGPVLSVQVANTDTFWDNFEFVVSTFFGELDAYDSSGLDKSAVYSGITLKLREVRADLCYRVIPHLALFADYHYKKYMFKRRRGSWPSAFPDEEEMYAGGLGLKAGLPLGKSGVFLYASGEIIPYAEFNYDDNTAWGATANGGIGYSVAGGEWLPVTLTVTAGYYYHKIDSDGYFDEQTDAGSADIVISW